MPTQFNPWLSPTPGLGMENIGGIFVVLICGLIIAVFVAVMEFIWSTRRSAESEEVRSLAEGVGQQWRPGWRDMKMVALGATRGNRPKGGARESGSWEVREPGGGQG